MTDAALKAALYLEAVLPALAHLAPHDEELRRAASGPRAFAVWLTVRGGSVRRLSFSADGLIATGTTPQPGDLRLWFPSANQFLRTMANRPALALPVGGWNSLGQVRRFSAAGARLETILNTRADSHLRLHAWGNVLVGVAAACAWLRHHPAQRAGLNGAGVIACPDFPAPIWFDADALTWGLGEPPVHPTVRITFANLSVVLAELDNRLDAPAALGLGDLKITGLQPLAEKLGLVMLKAGKLLKPATSN
ncbi:MAG: hypothetical protein WC661_00485 [Opitutaceae bacterium]|jgi:hypothetical protein